jgi:hypothetical protein
LLDGFDRFIAAIAVNDELRSGLVQKLLHGDDVAVLIGAVFSDRTGDVGHG